MTRTGWRPAASAVQVLRILVEPHDATPDAAVASPPASRRPWTATASPPRACTTATARPPGRCCVPRSRQGRDIRVGLEDTVVLADGRPASGNRELVEAAARLASEV